MTISEKLVKLVAQAAVQELLRELMLTGLAKSITSYLANCYTSHSLGFNKKLILRSTKVWFKDSFNLNSIHTNIAVV